MQFNVKVLLSHCIILISCLSLKAQNQSFADSLIIILKKKEIPPDFKIDLLGDISYYSTNPDDSHFYADELIKFAKEHENSLWLYRGYLAKGNAFKSSGDFSEAMEALFTSLKFAKEAGYFKGIAGIYIAIGDTYAHNNDHKNGIHFRNKAIEIIRETTDTITLASAILNNGYEYYLDNRFDSALLYFDESQQLFKSVDHELGNLYSIGNRGLVLSRTDNTLESKQLLEHVISELWKYEDSYAITEYELELSAILTKEQLYLEAEKYALEALNLGFKDNLKKRIRDAHYQLSIIYENIGKFEKAYQNQKAYLLYRDSINNEEITLKIGRIRTDYELLQKQTEIDLAKAESKAQRNLFFAGVAIFILILGIFISIIIRQKRNRIILEQDSQFKLIKSRLTALKSQINPHFLFNALSSIQNFVLKNDTSASEKYLKKYSKLMRYTLEYSDQMTISLHDELCSLENYIQLEQLRGDFKFQYSIQIEKNVDLYSREIPVMILQPIVENAIWHGLIPKSGNDGRLIICVKEEQCLIIQISDNGVGINKTSQKKHNSHKSFGTGLVRERIDLLKRLYGISFEMNITSRDQGVDGTNVEFVIPKELY